MRNRVRLITHRCRRVLRDRVLQLLWPIPNDVLFLIALDSYGGVLYCGTRLQALYGGAHPRWVLQHGHTVWWPSIYPGYVFLP